MPKIISKKRLGKTFFTALLLGLYLNTGVAQVLKYDNDEQLMGAAAASPSSTYLVLKRVVDKCGGYDDSLRASGDQALRSWEERHHAYLEENLRVREQFDAMLRTAPALHDEFRKMVEKDLPSFVDKQFQVYALAIDAQPTQSGKIDVCRSFIQAVLAQKFDLKANDPTLSAYLDKRIRSHQTSK
jgi:hypothetical protein